MVPQSVEKSRMGGNVTITVTLQHALEFWFNQDSHLSYFEASQLIKASNTLQTRYNNTVRV